MILPKCRKLWLAFYPKSHKIVHNPWLWGRTFFQVWRCFTLETLQYHMTEQPSLHHSTFLRWPCYQILDTAPPGGGRCQGDWQTPAGGGGREELVTPLSCSDPATGYWILQCTILPRTLDIICSNLGGGGVKESDTSCWGRSVWEL